MEDKEILHPHPTHMVTFEEFGQKTSTSQHVQRLPQLQRITLPKITHIACRDVKVRSFQLDDGLSGNILLSFLLSQPRLCQGVTMIWILPLLHPSSYRCWALINILLIDAHLGEDLELQNEIYIHTYFCRLAEVTWVCLEVRCHDWRCILEKQIWQECVED